MAEARKINKIPEKLKVGKQEFTYHGSRKTLKEAKEAKTQMNPHFNKVHIEPVVFKKEKYYLLFVITNADVELKANRESKKKKINGGKEGSKNN